MKVDRTLRSRLQEHYQKMSEKYPTIIKQVEANPYLLSGYIEDLKATRNQEWTFGDAIKEMKREYSEVFALGSFLTQAQTIIFSQEQALVFADAPKSYFGSLDFRLPFTVTWLQFTEALPVQCDGKDDSIIGIAMAQMEVDESIYYRSRLQHLRLFGNLDDFDASMPMKEIGGITTMMYPVFSDSQLRGLSWSTKHEAFFEVASDQNSEEWLHIKNIALACIGYVNAENVSLAKMGEVAEKVNRKRAAQGKRVLEPYYITKIRGVHYTAEGDPFTVEPSGRHVSFRFDVRGHFRKLPTGKVTWVRPHQRGVANELYLPKTYVLSDQ